MALLYVSQKSKFSAKKGIKPYAKPKVIPAYAQGVYKPSKPFHRTTEQLPSVESTGYSCCAKKQDKASRARLGRKRKRETFIIAE